MVKAASAPRPPMLDPVLVARLHDKARAARWDLSAQDFAAILERSVQHRFRDATPSPRDVVVYAESLHLEDLAVAVACARGHEAAWEHFVTNYRPALLAAAASCAPPGSAHEFADSLYADLFGIDEREGVRRSLFDYFHGRSSLATWLRAVLAQRVVDRVRETRRLEPLSEAGPELPAPDGADTPDPDRDRYLPIVRAALSATLAALAPRDRLRLALYYARQMTLAAVGRVLGESEATVSRKLDRTRTGIRQAVERRLREDHALGDAAVAACFEYAGSDPRFRIDPP